LSVEGRKVRVVVINYGVGNLRSICKALEAVGALPIISNEISKIRQADAIVLPGVGAYKAAMHSIRSFKDELIDILQRKPVLGICLGMQLLLEESEEGGHIRGLGLLKGKVTKLPTNVRLPHMGWNQVQIVNKHSPLVKGLPDKVFMYFAHSYAPFIDKSYTVAITEYGRPFPAIIKSKNLVGTQFHPEKSGRYGRILLRNFIELVRERSC